MSVQAGWASPGSPHIVLGVSGGIAAYKAAEIVRALVDRGASVRVLMTPAAVRFIAPLTLSVLSQNPVIHDLWDPASGAVDHVALARESHVLAIAPATADCLAKLARGLGDDALTTYALAHRTAIVLAPAMNTWMWAHPATQENVRTLRSRGCVFVEPEAGDLACGDFGPGRLASPLKIAEAILRAAKSSSDLAGRRIIVTAGPTREPIDPVRFVSNRSSGRMGYALAREAAKRGADVVLISGPVSLPPPPGMRFVSVERVAEMRDAVLAEVADADALIMAAAPADFVLAAPSSRKLKRADGPPSLTLVAAPDILKEAAAKKRQGTVIVAFAAETNDLVENAYRKLIDKGADLLVANDVSRPGTGFDSEENEVVILAERPDALGAAGATKESIERAPKSVIAARVLDRLTHLLDLRCPKTNSDALATR
ncbi:MAG: bifunctional phosphopantothenoylcysteine decarboxylase/phosphopantothenate--cysteine ligase CoaBC [Thermoanaerobaculia bacterium]